MKKNIFKKLSFGIISILTILSFYYLWKINHVPAGLELRSWFRISFGCWLIVFWQIAVVVLAVILINRLRTKVQSYFLRFVLDTCVIMISACSILYLTWNFFGIYIANEKDSENPNGTLTVYHDNDFLRPNDYSYRLYEKEGLLYRRYMRDMVDEHDYAVSCTDIVPDDSTGDSRPAEPSSALDAPELAFDVIENRETELVFNRSLNDFIDCYNQHYRTDHHMPYLQPASEWRNLVYPSAIHSEHETILYEFSYNPKIWSQPTITAYVPTNKEYIQEITVNFDEHGYSESFYDAFEELCYYTLKVFFPELSDEQIIHLYTELNMLGDQNVFDNDQGYEKGCIPCVLYHKNGIGVYPYFAVGEWQHLCIIPVTEETRQDFADKGVEIHEIK